MEKEVKFEVGKWYSMKTIFSWIIKYKDTINGQIKAEWYCENIPGQKVEEGGNWSTKPTNIKELSLEEIQQYLPDGHPDKIKSNDFKVGDWVVIIKSSKNWAYEMDAELGKVVQITYISDTSYINYEGKPKWSFGAKDGHFRHATPEEINNHLISIGQIPAGKPLNTGIEPNKDGVFRFNSTTGSPWTGLTPTNHLGAIYQGDIMGKPANPKMILSIDDEELPMVSIIKTNSIKQLLKND